MLRYLCAPILLLAAFTPALRCQQGWTVQSSYFGTPCRSWSGGLSFMSVYLLRSPGNQLSWRVVQKGYGSWPPIANFLILGRTSLNIPMQGGLPVLPGCSLYVRPDVLVFMGQNTWIQMSIPMDSRWNGVSIYGQILLWEVNPGGLPGGGARKVNAIHFSDGAMVTLHWKS